MESSDAPHATLRSLTCASVLLFTAGLINSCGPGPRPLPETVEAQPAIGAAATDTVTPPPATPTFAPLTEATEPIVLEPPEPPPTQTLSPPPLHLPDSSLALFRPGPGSQVTSPMQVAGHGGPSFEERLRIRLLGADGALLAERMTILFAYPGNPGRFAANVPFEIEGVSTAATIQLDTFDRRYGRLAQRYSQEVVLLSTGSERIRPGYQGPSQLAILSPREGVEVKAGTVVVSGGGWSSGAGPIVLQAIDRNGNVLDSTPVELSSGTSGRIGTFEGSLEFHLERSQFGRLMISELDADLGEPRFLQSIEVYFRR